jgi:nicotinamidase-related amidase
LPKLKLWTPIYHPIYYEETIMTPEKTALILIGYQNDYFAPDGILHAVIEESSRVTGVIDNTVDLIQRLTPTPTLIISTPIIFTADYKELVDPVGILETIKERGAFKAGTGGRGNYSRNTPIW